MPPGEIEESVSSESFYDVQSLDDYESQFIPSIRSSKEAKEVDELSLYAFEPDELAHPQEPKNPVKGGDSMCMVTCERGTNTDSTSSENISKVSVNFLKENELLRSELDQTLFANKVTLEEIDQITQKARHMELNIYVKSKGQRCW